MGFNNGKECNINIELINWITNTKKIWKKDKLFILDLALLNNIDGENKFRNSNWYLK